MKAKFIIPFFLLIICGCKTEDIVHNSMDDYPVAKEYSAGNLDFKNISLSELNQSLEFAELLNSFNSQGTSSSNGNANRISLNQYEFTIDTTNIKEIQSGDYLSYTFAIKRENGKGLIENLLLEDKGGIKKAFILSYIPDINWLVAGPSQSNPFYGNVEIEEIPSAEFAFRSGSISII